VRVLRIQFKAFIAKNDWAELLKLSYDWDFIAFPNFVNNQNIKIRIKLKLQLKKQKN